MSSFAIDKMCFSTHFLESRGSIIRTHVLNYRTKQATRLRTKLFWSLFATNKAKHLLNMHSSCSCSDTIYSKSIKKNKKKFHF